MIMISTEARLSGGAPPVVRGTAACYSNGGAKTRRLDANAR
jgi:hypothetical protein